MNETQLVLVKLLGVFLLVQLVVTGIRSLLSPSRVPLPENRDEDTLN